MKYKLKYSPDSRDKLKELSRRQFPVFREFAACQGYIISLSVVFAAVPYLQLHPQFVSNSGLQM